VLKSDKELSFGERRLLEQATSLITMELAYALKREQSEIKEQIDDLFHDVLMAQAENK